MPATEKQIAALKAASAKRELLTTSEASEFTGYTQDHIGLMLRRGLIAGEKKGRDWFVDATSLYDYVKKNPRPGRKSI